MLDIFDGITHWANEKKQFAIVTVIQTWGSSPRPVGSALVIAEDGSMLGSVSGGCVEGAVAKKALEILQTGIPQTVSFGISDDDAWAVGLSCGGNMKVFIEKFVASDNMSIWNTLQRIVEENKGGVLLSCMTKQTSEHALVLPSGEVLGAIQDKSLINNCLEVYAQRKNQIIVQAEQQYFAQVFPRKCQLLIVGAAHITVDLVDLANQFGFETIVIDPRGFFANNTVFHSQPHHLHIDWPAEVIPEYTLDSYTFAVLLTHDPKIDDQALHQLLRSNVAYIGALGSKKTHEKRVNRLRNEGFTEEEMDKIYAPIGVAINAKTPKEIALSIIAELIQQKNAFL